MHRSSLAKTLYLILGASTFPAFANSGESMTLNELMFDGKVVSVAITKPPFVTAFVVAPSESDIRSIGCVYFSAGAAQIADLEKSMQRLKYSSTDVARRFEIAGLIDIRYASNRTKTLLLETNYSNVATTSLKIGAQDYQVDRQLWPSIEAWIEKNSIDGTGRDCSSGRSTEGSADKRTHPSMRLYFSSTD
ncbi:MAG TPA: hypothetical protein VGM81_09580 [Burkholderiaceae bacterium]|jgi:hypothetical protein